MNNIVYVLLVFLIGITSANVSAQVSFSKGSVIKKSYASSTMMVPPVLGKSNDGFFILSSAIMSSKKIVRVNLDKDMNQSGEEVVFKLPKGKAVRRILNVDNSMVVILWSGKKSDPFECYSYDSENYKLGNLLLSIPVDDYPGREELDISILNDDFQDFLGFIIRPKVEYAHTFRKVVLTNRNVDKIVWSQVITDPYVTSREMLGEFSLLDVYFNNAHTLIARFSRPFLEEKKEEVLTEMYYFDGNKISSVWHDQVIRSTVKEELLSLPLPYLSANNKVEVYNLFCDKERSSFDLVKTDIRGDEIKRFSFKSEIDNLNSINRVGLYAQLMPVNKGFENGNFCFLIAEQLNPIGLEYQNSITSHKHFMVSFNLNEEGLLDDKIIDVGWPEAVWGELDSRILLANSLDAVIGDKMIENDQKTVFDRCEESSKKTRSGVTYHYVLDDELFSLHSEYSTKNMTSQLVKWNFE